MMFVSHSDDFTVFSTASTLSRRNLDQIFDTPCSHDSAVDLDMRTTKTTLAPANQLLHTL